MSIGLLIKCMAIGENKTHVTVVLENDVLGVPNLTLRHNTCNPPVIGQH